MDVCVIGAGLLGLSTAYQLARLGCSVAVIERREGVGLETSYANGGMLHASQAAPWNEPGILSSAVKMLGKEDAPLLVRAKALPHLLRWGGGFVRESKSHRYEVNLSKNARLARYSIDTLREIVATTDIAFEQNSKGTLKLYRSEQALRQALKFTHRFEALDIPYELMDANTVVEIEPALAPIKNDFQGGIYFPADEIGDAYLYCQGLHNVCERLGVQFKFNCEVLGFEKFDGKLKAAVSSDGKVVADRFVLATASYSPRITKPLGIRLPIQPVKGYSLTVPNGAWQQPPKIAVIDEEMHAAVCPLGERLRVAGTAEFAGYDTSVTSSRMNNLAQLLENLYPEFRQFLDPKAFKSWTGLRPMTPDGVGIMSRTKIDNLFINSGHGHLGWTMAPGAGKIVADLLTGRPPDLDMDDYSLGRFN